MAALLEVRDLVTEFGKGLGLLAVNGVSFSLERGKVLGLVGESGSGKSVTGFSIMRLLDKPGRIASGQILFDGVDLASLSEGGMRSLRGKRIAMVFQDPMMTLNPVLTIGTQLVEAVLAHDSVSRETARQRARDALGLVGIPSPEERLSAYPHEFSGGMRQRVAIAIAILHRPDLIIADEPTTALDVTIQSQIISEFQRLTEQSNTSVIWITHDLAIVSRLADDIAVMMSVPSQNRRGQPLRQIPGITPALNRLPPGCSFRARCVRATAECAVMPDISWDGGRAYRCFHPVAGALDD